MLMFVCMHWLFKNQIFVNENSLKLFIYTIWFDFRYDLLNV